MSIPARTLRALIGLNGPDWLHLGPLLTPSAHSLGAPGSSALGTQTLPGLCFRCACLQPCLWPHLLGGPWTRVVDPSASLIGWLPDLVHPLAVSGAVDGPHYQHPALLRSWGMVPWSVRAQLCWGHPWLLACPPLWSSAAPAAPWCFSQATHTPSSLHCFPFLALWSSSPSSCSSSPYIPILGSFCALSFFYIIPGVYI